MADQARVAEAAEALRGTPRALHDELTEDEMNDLEFCQALDNEVFCCAGCEWWCEISEAISEDDAGSPVCEDCTEHEEE